MFKLFVDNRNFRFLLMYLSFSNIGVGIFNFFMMWVVHYQYQNPIFTGIAGFMFALSGVASFSVGPFVDKHNKIRLIRVICLVQLCVVCFLLVISSTSMPSVWFLLFAILIFDAARMVGAPTIPTLLPMTVSSEDLMKANAIIRIVGTVVGLGIGVFLYLIMVGGTGFEVVYAVNAAVLLIALAFSAFAKNSESKKYDETVSANYFGELKTGLIFVRHGVMMHLVLALLFQSIFFGIASVNIPMFAEIHTGTAAGYILIMALMLVGGVLGPAISQIVGPKYKLSIILAVGFIFAGVVRIIFVNVIADDFWRSLWVLVIYAGLNSTISIFFQTLMQKLPSQNLVGRVDTINTSLRSVAVAIGSLLGGLAGTFFQNIDMIFIIQGISYIVIGVCIYFSKRIRKLPKINDVATIR